MDMALIASLLYWYFSGKKHIDLSSIFVQHDQAVLYYCSRIIGFTVHLLRLVPKLHYNRKTFSIHHTGIS